MSSKDELLKNLHKIIREDAYVNEMCKSLGIEIDELKLILQDIYNQFWFDTMTWGAYILAKQLGIILKDDLTQEEKNTLVKTRWKQSGKNDKELLQNICDNWENGETEVFFNNGTIEVKFVAKQGIPSDLGSLKKEINKAKNAGFLVEYLFKYFLIGDIHGKMTIGELEHQTLDKFAF